MDYQEILEKRKNKQYRRTCACYKLMKQNKINKTTAIYLMKIIGIKNAESTVNLWSFK